MASPLKLDKYDIIICGGGTAGCVLAARLTEDPNLIVLVLEAGEDANDDFRIFTPGLFPLLLGSDRDWDFMSEPSPGLYNRQIGHPRGKCIGGSSAMNLMSMIYPGKASLNAWADFGNRGWDWESLAPYYEKFQRHFPPSEDVQDALSIDFLDPKLQGTKGPIAVSYPGKPSTVQKAWVDTWKGLGRQLQTDPQAGMSTGGYICGAAVDPEKAQRSHAGVEYYKPVATRQNLHVITGAMIERIEFDGRKADSIIASGVTFTHSGERYTARASREIILSAGAFGSPAVLERSGIGAQNVCDTIGVECLIDNPNVGENLQDHIMCGAGYEVKDGVPTADVMRDPAIIQKAMEAYQTSRSGPLAGGAGYTFAITPLLDFITPISKDELKQLLDKYLPDTTEPGFQSEKQHYAFARSVLESPDEASASLCLIECQFGGGKAKASEAFSFTEPKNYVTLLPGLAHPFSRGSVHVQSKEAAVYPKIAPNYLSHPLDAEVMGRHMMQIETFVNAPPFSDILKPDGERIPHGKDALTLENAIDLVRSAATSNYHPCGTCAMMPKELGGVVDDRLRVHGVKGLRVCDASIFPIQVRGNIMSTVYASAEKASDMLKEDLAV